MGKYKIAIIGECMVELQRDDNDDIRQTFGGDTLNTAAYLSRLSRANIDVSYITGLGNDSLSNEMINRWSNEGISTNLVTRVEGKNPGIYLIETDQMGERQFFYWRSDSAAKYLFENKGSEDLIESLLEFDVIYLSGISLAILTEKSRIVLLSFLRSFSKKGGIIAFDNNYRETLWKSKEEALSAYQEILKLTDIALLTFEDEKMLYGDKTLEDCIKRSSNAGIKEIVIKRGKDSCLVVESQNRTFVPSILTNNIVDTTAAGDSFSGGYLASRLNGRTPVESAHSGHIMASTVIRYKGAIIPSNAMPNIF